MYWPVDVLSHIVVYGRSNLWATDSNGRGTVLITQKFVSDTRDLHRDDKIQAGQDKILSLLATWCVGWPYRY